MAERRDIFHCASDWQPVFRELGIDAEAVFSHPQVQCWRKLSDRENCTLNERLGDGRQIRLHIKRYIERGPRRPAADAEVQGFHLLQQHGILTAPLVAWGRLADGRSFVISEDLTGFNPADKLVEGGADFNLMLGPIAQLAAKLHQSQLHHRDLYLCHFFVRSGGEPQEVRLIDVARVRRLPWLFARRWVVKDLAQLWYSTLALSISNEQRAQLMQQYASHRGIEYDRSLRRVIERKSTWIARHDRKLRRSQPTRNISIPQPEIR
jgi:hypothetical protein